MLQRAQVCNGKENGLSVLNLGDTKLIFYLPFPPLLVTANKSHKKHRNKHVVIHNGNSVEVHLRAVNKATFTFLFKEFRSTG